MGVCERLAGDLLNMLNDAKAEDDLARRDSLLDELRALAHTYPDKRRKLAACCQVPSCRTDPQARHQGRPGRLGAAC